jgi:hypothetical protein
MYSSSTPGYALAFGNIYSGGVHAKTLDELYPDFILYDRFAGEFRTWTFAPRTVQVRQMLVEGRCVLLEGSPSGKYPMPLEPEFTTELIAEAGNQAIYRLLPAMTLR